MKRENEERRQKGQKFSQPRCACLIGRPRIAEAVADPFYDDGEVREVYTLSLSWAMGPPQVSLNDRPNGRSITSSGDTIEEALDAMEKLLARGGALPWRYWAPRRGKKG